MNRSMWKSTFREIRSSFGRFFAILAIVALGVGFFAGLKVTTEAMVKTTQRYLTQNQFYDFRLISTQGFGQEEADFLNSREQVRAAEGAVSFDVILRHEKGKDYIVKAHSLTENVNRVKLLAGRMPESGDECVVDSNLFDASQIGSVLSVSEENSGEDAEAFAFQDYEIVGVVQSPCYIQFERGNTSLGSGRINGFIYLMPQGFDTDYFTEIYVKFDRDAEIYSREYEDFIAGEKAVWEKLTTEAAARRRETLLSDAREELRQAEEEFEEQKSDGQEELDEAAGELADAAAELDDGERQLTDARGELDRAGRTLEEKGEELRAAREELERERQKLEDAENTIRVSIDTWNSENDRVERAKKDLEAGRQELDAQKAVLDENTEKLAQAEALLAEKETLLSDSEKALEARKGQLEDSARLLDLQEEQINRKQQELDSLEQSLKDQNGGVLPPGAAEQLAAGRSELEAGRSELEAGRAQLQEGLGQLQAAEEQLAAGRSELEAGRAQLEQSRSELEVGRRTILEYGQKLDEGRAQLADGDRQLDHGWMDIQEGQAQAAEGRGKLEEAAAQLADGEKQFADGQKELADAWRELAGKEQELADGRAEYEEGLREYEDARREFQEQIADAEEELADARREINDLEEPDTYVLGRDTNVGYVSFENDSSIVNGIANIFPVFFFCVAALVCITTMNRMVEEQRTQIGVLKALGYGEGVVMSKYLLYSGTAALLGCVGGFFGGTWLFPHVIWRAYGIMYLVDNLLYVFDWRLAVISLTVSLACSLGATYLSCRYELFETAARLMRPKSPKAGKRVLLEYVPFVWKRLKFLHKVSLRNIFRYKKRFFMMVIGISGCTALLVTGFGIRDSIAHIGEKQFGEIQTFDISVTFSEPPAVEKLELLAGMENVEAILPVMEKSADLVKNGRSRSVNLVVTAAETERTAELSGFITLRTKEGAPLEEPGKGEAILSDKAAEDYGIAIGEEITLLCDDGRELLLKVSGICENYIYNYVYINGGSIREQFGEEPACKTVYVKLDDAGDPHSAAAGLMKLEGTTAFTVNADTRERFDSMMQSLNMIVLVVILCAAGLAFVVLYNLTNINITERIREIATIKVLGFYQKETASYVFRENVVLTFFGTIVGLVLGHFLHLFVMSEINIDMVAFDIRVRPMSYLYSAVLTFAFAWLVNGLMRRKLGGVSMTESLKSVD